MIIQTLLYSQQKGIVYLWNLNIEYQHSSTPYPREHKLENSLRHDHLNGKEGEEIP